MINRRQKYNAVRTNGFASKGEHFCHEWLKQREAAGELTILHLQPKYFLTKASIGYRGDFLLSVDSRDVCVDFKGLETPRFKLITKLWKHYGPCDLWIVKGRSVSSMQIDRVISPKE